VTIHYEWVSETERGTGTKIKLTYSDESDRTRIQKIHIPVHNRYLFYQVDPEWMPENPTNEDILP